jgi:hypothetical protein
LAAQSDWNRGQVHKVEPTGLWLHFDPVGSLLQATLDCENDVFCERYGEDRTALEGYHAPYAGSSTFLSLADADGHVVAMSRLVYPSPAGLITLVDIEADPWNADAATSFAQTGLDPARTWDVSAVCVRKSSSGQTALLAAAIYHGLIKTMRANHVDGFLAVLDARVHRILNMLGVVMHPLPGVETKPYWGSPATMPAYARFPQVIDGQRRMSPDAYRLVTLGVGLDGIRVPADDAFVLHRPRSVQLPERPAARAIDLSVHPQAAESARR